MSFIDGFCKVYSDLFSFDWSIDWYAIGICCGIVSIMSIASALIVSLAYWIVEK